MFYAKLDLFRMNITEIKDPDCEYCIEFENTKKHESLRQILTEFKKLAELWTFFSQLFFFKQQRLKKKS